jgi:hypothetical protein
MENNIQTIKNTIISSSSSEPMNQPSFHYIEENQLRKLFGICMDNGCRYLTVYFCLYSINNNCFIEGTSTSRKDNTKIEYFNIPYPFVEYLIENHENKIQFPKMYYECPHFQDKMIDADSDKSVEQIHFETECMKHFFSFFDEDTSFHQDMFSIENIYKGFVEGSSSSHVYVFFDITGMKQTIKTTYSKAILDELYVKKKVNDVKVHERVTEFIETNPELRYVRDQNGHRLQRPMQLYLCKKTENGYVSVRNDETPVYKPYEHELFGPAFYFSTQPLPLKDINNSIPSTDSGYRRYACYESRTFVLRGDITTDITDEQKQQIQETILMASTFSFNENNIPMWGIKNILQFTEIQ